MFGSKNQSTEKKQQALGPPSLLRRLLLMSGVHPGVLLALTASGMALFMSGCGSNAAPVTVAINPTSATVVLGGSQQFVAAVNNSTNPAVNWSVTGTNCTGNACGTITNPTPTSPAVYTAPSALPSASSNTVTVTATSQANSGASASAKVTLDSGIRVSIAPASVTIGTAEFVALTPTVTGVNSVANSMVTWMVSGTANGNTTVGQVCVNPNPTPTTCTAPGSTGTASGTPVFFVAPTTVPTGTTTVTATSTADTTRSGSATITILTAADPVLNGTNPISPATAAQGSVFQDVYLNGTNFFSTSTVLAGFGSTFTPVETIFLSTTVLRARIPSCPSSLNLPGCPGNLLQAAGTLNIEVQRQNGNVSGTAQLTVMPQRPALLAVAPESEPQCSTPTCSAQTVLLTGGYYLPPPMTTALFNGSGNGVVVSQNAVNPTTQLNVTIPDSATTTAGLFSLVLQNAGNPQMSGINIAIEPAPAVNPPSTIATATVGTSPVAVAVNLATGKAVTANSGDNTISVIDLTSCTGGACSAATSMPVGKNPTGVAVDSLRNLAVVVNQGDDTVSVVDLSGAKQTFTIGLPASCPVPSGTTPTPIVPVSIGENPATGHAVVANQSTNCATVIDITQTPPTVGTDTFSIGTGLNPRIAIEPKLDWAVITPGGAGTISIVDMNPDHQIVNPNISSTQLSFLTVASVSFTTTVQGVGLNTETEQAFFTDPSGTFGRTFSILDQTVGTVTLGTNFVDAAVNPLTNIGFAIDNQTNVGTLVDLERVGFAPAVLQSGIPLGPAGSNPFAVAIDPVSDEAVVANQGNNTVTVLSLGAIRSLQIAQMSPAQLIVPANNATDQMVTLIGSGFVAGSTARLDGQPLPAANINVVSAREITATVPAALLQTPRRYVVDVLNPDGSVSNVTKLGVIPFITVGNAPGAVAIDEQRNIAVVTNTIDKTVDLVDLVGETVLNPTPISVGTNPQGVDVIARLGRAVVTNNGDNTASVIDVVGQAVIGSAVSVGQAPIGVAINQDTAIAVIANSAGNSLSLFAADNPSGSSSAGSVSVDQAPVGVRIDVNRNLAAVACATQNTVDVVDLAARLITGRPGGPTNSLFLLPSAVAFDPATDMFLVANGEINDIVIFDPASLTFQAIATGINPTSIAYNFQSDTILTANSLSHTVSVLDFLGKHVRAVLIVDGSPQQAVAIDSQTNLAVVVDQKHNRILLVPPSR